MASSAAVAMTEEEKKNEVADVRDVESVDDDGSAEISEARASEKRRVAPPPLPAEEACATETTKPDESAKAASPTKTPVTSSARKRFPLSATLFGILLLLNASAIAGTVLTRREARRNVAPIGSIASSVGQLAADHAGTRAELEQTKKQLAVQDAKLAAVARATDETAARQKASEHEARERDAKAARELAAVAGRVSTLERRARDGAVTLSLSEALPVLDAVSGAGSSPPPAPRKPHTH